MSNRVNIAQKRAEKAFEYAEIGNQVDKYDAYVKRLPMLIRTNGLGNSIAFMYSKSQGENGWALLYKQLDDWFYNESQEIIREKMDDLGQGEVPREPVLMKLIAREKDDFVIRQMTSEVLSLANWLKRFVIKKD